MEIEPKVTEDSAHTVQSKRGLPLWPLWFCVHLAIVYVIVHFCTPWLAGWIRGKVLPFLQYPTSSSSFQFLFSHLFSLSFFPALIAGAANTKFKHRAAEWIWLVPTAILIYKLLTFPSATSVLVQSASWPAFHHYFRGGFLIPSASNWKDFWMLIGTSDDTARGLDQLYFTAPFYAGIAYSMATCIALRTNLSRRLTDAFKGWEEQRFGTPQAQ